MIVINLAAILLLLESNCFKNDKLSCVDLEKKAEYTVHVPLCSLHCDI